MIPKYLTSRGGVENRGVDFLAGRSSPMVPDHNYKASNHFGRVSGDVIITRCLHKIAVRLQRQGKMAALEEYCL
jgi:hypothetical protein